MKNIFLIVIVISSLYSLNVRGYENENQLIYLYNNINKAATKLNNLGKGTDLVVSYSDSLEKANVKFIDFFLKILRSDNSMQNDFSKLKNETDISIIQSKDKKIRFFSWDTQLGGTMNQIAIVVQYLGSDGKSYAKIISSDGLLNTNLNSPGAIFDRVYEIDNNNSKYYLATGEFNCDITCITNQIYAYSISDTSLTYPKVIIHNNIDTNSLSFNYDINNLKIKWEPKYIVNEEKKTISEPIILENKGITQKKYKTYSIVPQTSK